MTLDILHSDNNQSIVYDMWHQSTQGIANER